ncbi:MAG: response regulator [Candidatus Komeilibacteria bacterium CG11_big_fil_rev_8_21_14_0_20_36_20]|uniref:Response regulator n=1 Tax=Candidatus Komeilibacteria bacterium CG11_big_fil_rev_8_21_14_0_20_36_20 TaxID=1974477 RepID=A0A2H0NDK0_9BACT|nr:MAG: response regulator [Candidatus Komeilibacteria bacterium CG11_big_fil_rev_8_21_14_0_20_36_20]PIR81328.1 MAG: response regulator [Candidatus Komeilibacteria bacterium CG10_big_fil_rev_8_21_14_0_10_36_65]PJC54958.1 MAG: response regulator [Candidatus Komeilibacteria bacterium CG_4_9_14_0_2_um_filter_36_13]
MSEEEKKAKILFIDDDNFLRKVYKSELSEHNYEVVLAANGDEGLAKANTEDPDLIILDMIMPKKNGFEVLIELQGNAKTKNIPVIILSNLGQDDDVKKGLDLGAVDYLVKDNITLVDIVNKVSQYLNSKTKSKKARNNGVESFPKT